MDVGFYSRACGEGLRPADERRPSPLHLSKPLLFWARVAVTNVLIFAPPAMTAQGSIRPLPKAIRLRPLFAHNGRPESTNFVEKLRRQATMRGVVCGCRRDKVLDAGERRRRLHLARVRRRQCCDAGHARCRRSQG